MTLKAAAARPYKIAAYLLLLIITVTLWAQAGGYLFLKAAGLDASKATPLTMLRYYVYYGHDPATLKWLAVSAGGAFAGLLCLAAVIWFPKPRKMFGNARWAGLSDVKKAGLRAQSGVVLGKLKGRGAPYLIFNGPAHVLMTAETREGKGVGVVIPTLLSWEDSAVVLDIKRENRDVTAGYRAGRGQECYLLNLAPQDKRGHCWNPLHYISEDPDFAVNDIQKIGAMLFPDIDGAEPVWAASARSLWLGIVLYLLETEELPVTIGEAFRQVMAGDAHLKRATEARKTGENALSPTCLMTLNEYLETPEKTRGSVRKTFTSALEIFANPVIDAVTSSNDFDLYGLRKKRMTVYVNLTVNDLTRLKPVINLFFQQLIDINTRELPEQNPAYKYPCLIVADEFASLGYAGVLANGISYIAGYGLRMLTIVQSLSQIHDIYGKNAFTFIQNHTVKVFFAPSDKESARDLSETLGNRTVKVKSYSRKIGASSGDSVNVSETSRALMLPQELKDMGQKSSIIIAKHCPPVSATKIRWFDDPAFAGKGYGRNKKGEKPPELPEIVIREPKAITPPHAEEQEDRDGEIDALADRFYERDV